MSEKGYEATTVAEIAERAGLTERTFFRHFSDKREVLFAGSQELEKRFVAALEAEPSSLAPITAVEHAIEAESAMLSERAFARRRQELIASNPELMERERVKLAHVAVMLADALRKRGTDAAAASLAAEMGVTLFRLAFERWIEEEHERPLPDVVRDAFAQMRKEVARR